MMPLTLRKSRGERKEKKKKRGDVLDRFVEVIQGLEQDLHV